MRRSLLSRPARAAGAALLLSGLLILWIGHFTDIDLALADAVFDHAAHHFPMQHAWLAERFNHVILKSLLSALGGSAVALALWDAVRPRPGWSDATRVGMRVVAISAVAVPLVISLLKQFSTSHCPWDLQRYGGSEPYVRLLEWMPSGVAAGHCMPGGHASSALWLISIAAFWWPHSRAKGIAVGLSMLIFGLAVGWIQQLRGAHFLTHTLWSAWIACALVLAIYLMNSKGLARRFGAGYNSVPAATQP
ncbi:phosphatase PAP2 family protein [Massilia sp. METH4]|uniref:phosphatase PAP2 family protein n=1 Tax=Massilia sp. METH4 TaxID=3123041 RepID=UPI0030D2777E